MKSIRVYIGTDEKGKTTVSAKTQDGERQIEADDWNTIVQVLRIRQKGVNPVLIWDIGTWDDYVWG